MGYLSRMLKSHMCALLVVLSVACTDSSPPSEEECAPHKAAWIEEAVQDRATLSEEIRKQVEAEIRRSMVASGPTIGEGERKALERAAAPSAPSKPSDDEPQIEAHPGPNKLTSKDREALADDPASGVRVPTPTVPKEAVIKPKSVPEATSAKPEHPPELDAGNETLKLTELVIALDVKNRQPISPGSRFDAGPQQFFCYTVYDSDLEGQTSTHVWRYKDKVLSRVELSVGKSPSWRTWSRHRASKSATGTWSCEVLDAEGKRLGKTQFIVGR